MLLHVQALNPDDIVKFRIKEDWVFDREASSYVLPYYWNCSIKNSVFSVDKKTESRSHAIILGLLS